MTIPLTAEVIHPFSETHQWTEEDRTNGSAITEWWGEFSKSIMTRHLERHHWSVFYGGRVGACISQGFKEELCTELGIESSAHLAEA